VLRLICIIPKCIQNCCRIHQGRSQRGTWVHAPRHRRSISVTAPLVFSRVFISYPWTPLGTSVPQTSGLSPLVNSWLCPWNSQFYKFNTGRLLSNTGLYRRQKKTMSDVASGESNRTCSNPSSTQIWWLITCGICIYSRWTYCCSKVWS